MKKENIILLIAVLLFAGVVAYYSLQKDNPTINPIPITPTTQSSETTTKPNNSMNPNYGSLTPEQITIADKAIGKLLNSSEGITPPMITVVSFEAKNFSDTSLGCAQPDMMYAQVITPGYQVVLSAQGKQYDYRIGSGETVILCG